MSALLASALRNTTKLIACMTIALLTACKSNVIAYHGDDDKRLPTGVTGASDATRKELQDQFKSSNVQVLSIGQDYLISIPSSALFADQSPQIQWQSFSLLNDIACYLRQFQKIEIHISGYSTKYRSSARERALTLARAKAVGNYLWSQGVESRFLFTQGLGSDKPIVAFTHLGDKSPNSRIEITFRNVVA